MGFLYRLTEDIKDTYNFDGNLIRRLEYESIPLPILYAAQASTKNFQRMKSTFNKEEKINQADIENILELLYTVSKLSAPPGRGRWKL